MTLWPWCNKSMGSSVENGIQPWSHQTSSWSFIFIQKTPPPPVHPDLVFNGIFVPKVNEHKHLGLTLQSNLSFEKHLNGKMTMAEKVIGILKHLSNFLPPRTLVQMYKSRKFSSSLLWYNLSYATHCIWAFRCSFIFSQFDPPTKFNTRRTLPLRVVGKALVGQNCIMN